MHKTVIGKDLTKEAPRSPRIRIGGYVISPDDRQVPRAGRG
jgi:hypothetical protein